MKKNNTFAEGRFTKVNQVQVDPHHIVLENRPVRAVTAFVKTISVFGIPVIEVPKEKPVSGRMANIKAPAFDKQSFGKMLQDFRKSRPFKHYPKPKIPRDDQINGCFIPSSVSEQERFGVSASASLEIVLPTSTDKPKFVPLVQAGIDLRKNQQVHEVPSDVNKQLAPPPKPEDFARPSGGKGTGNGSILGLKMDF